ncbi:unnamed protein product [Citrullus colocynthis]|uniref:Uncharacterized protein n=1 Tax=Citrullus colocynthis TaxID=252529 RepID=A0ABP0YPM7_9ROSI
MDDSPMDPDPKSVNATCDFENKQHDNQPNDQKLKQKVQDLDDNQPQDFETEEKCPENANLEGREENDRVPESSKRTRIAGSPGLVKFMVHHSSDPSLESMKLIEDIVRIYGYHVDHVVLEAKYGTKHGRIWNFDRPLCGGVGETFAQKVRRLGCELERMKNDENQFKNYLFMGPRITQIMSQLLMIHKLFDPSFKARAVSEKEEQRFCANLEREMDQFRKEFCAITAKIEGLKNLRIYRKTMDEKRRYYRI